MINKECIKMIKQFEGCQLTIYLDPVGIPTGGYGHTAGLTKGMVGNHVTQAQADKWLQEDLAKFEKKVDKYDAKYHWTENERSALISFAFNIGSIDGLTNNGKRTKSEIATKLLSYNKSGGVPLKGLTRRRQAEHDMFLSDKSNSEIAREVLAGKWGVGEDRKKRLTEAGYDYKSVQAEVNKLRHSS